MNNCPICLEKCNKILKLDCSHHFCRECIEKWKGKKMHCPLCRSIIFPNIIKSTRNNIYEKDAKEIEIFWKDFLIHDRVITFIVNILKISKMMKENTEEYKQKKRNELILSEKIQQYYNELQMEIQNMRNTYNLKFYFWNLFTDDHKKLLEKEIYQIRYNLKIKYIKDLEKTLSAEYIEKFKKDTFHIPIESNNNDKFYQMLTNNNNFPAVIFIPFHINSEIDFRNDTIDEIINEITREMEPYNIGTDDNNDNDTDNDTNDDTDNNTDVDVEDNDEDDDTNDDDTDNDDDEDDNDIFFDKIKDFLKNTDKEYSKDEFEKEFTFIMKSIFIYNFFNVEKNTNFVIFLENYKNVIYKIIDSYNLNFCKLAFNQYNELYKLYSIGKSMYFSEISTIYENILYNSSSSISFII